MLGPADRGKHHRLDVTLHRVHRAMDEAPFELGQYDLIAVQLGEARAPEGAVQVEAWGGAMRGRARAWEIREGGAVVRGASWQLNRRGDHDRSPGVGDDG